MLGLLRLPNQRAGLAKAHCKVEVIAAQLDGFVALNVGPLRRPGVRELDPSPEWVRRAN